MTGSPPSTSPQFCSRAESQSSLTQSQSEEQGQGLHGAAISSVRKERSLLFPLSLSLSSKGQQEGPQKSPLWLGEGAWEAGPSPTSGVGIPNILSSSGLGTSAASRPTMATQHRRVSQSSPTLPSSPSRIHFIENHHSSFPHLCQVPSKHIGVVGKPSEMTNKYFNYRFKKKYDLK